MQAARFAPQDKNGFPAFYTQSISANGFPIVASAKVNAYALKEAEFLVNQMLANRPDVRTAMITSGARMCIMAYNEYSTDLPEFFRLKQSTGHGIADISGQDFYDARAR